MGEGATQVVRKGVLESTLKTQGTVSNCIAFVGKTAKTKTSVAAFVGNMDNNLVIKLLEMRTANSKYSTNRNMKRYQVDKL